MFWLILSNFATELQYIEWALFSAFWPVLRVQQICVIAHHIRGCSKRVLFCISLMKDFRKLLWLRILTRSAPISFEDRKRVDEAPADFLHFSACRDSQSFGSFWYENYDVCSNFWSKNYMRRMEWYVNGPRGPIIVQQTGSMSQTLTGKIW